MDSKVTGWLDLIVKTVTGSISHFWEFFGVYTSKYAKVILIIIALLVMRPLFRHIHIGGGKR